MNQPHQTGLLLSPPARPAARTASYSLSSGIGAKPLRRRPVRSLTRAVVYLCFSAMACAASLSWLLTAPSSQSISPVAHPSLNTSHEITSRLLVGGIGICLSVGFGIIGLLYWPGGRNIPVRRQDVSLSTYDSVTGLPGRRLYLVLLSQALTRAATMSRTVAVLVATLEEFRPLPPSPTVPNATLVVRVQAARIKSALQPHDAVARLSTHTFAVMVDNLESADKAIPIAEKIQSAMSLPLLVEGQELLLSCRIGVATSPQDGTNAELLLDAASEILSISPTDNGSIVFLSDPATQSSALPSTSSSIAPSTDDRRPTISVNR